MLSYTVRFTVYRKRSLNKFIRIQLGFSTKQQKNKRWNNVILKRLPQVCFSDYCFVLLSETCRFEQEARTCCKLQLAYTKTLQRGLQCRSWSLPVWKVADNHFILSFWSSLMMWWTVDFHCSSYKAVCIYFRSKSSKKVELGSTFAVTKPNIIWQRCWCLPIVHKLVHIPARFNAVFHCSLHNPSQQKIKHLPLWSFELSRVVKSSLWVLQTAV